MTKKTTCLLVNYPDPDLGRKKKKKKKKKKIRPTDHGKKFHVSGNKTFFCVALFVNAKKIFNKKNTYFFFIQNESFFILI